MPLLSNIANASLFNSFIGFLRAHITRNSGNRGEALTEYAAYADCDHLTMLEAESFFARSKLKFRGRHFETDAQVLAALKG